MKTVILITQKNGIPFSHINLILDIEEKFKLKKIKPSKIANLTSYKACYKYIITEQSR